MTPQRSICVLKAHGKVQKSSSSDQKIVIIWNSSFDQKWNKEFSLRPNTIVLEPSDLIWVSATTSEFVRTKPEKSCSVLLQERSSSETFTSEKLQMWSMPQFRFSTGETFKTILPSEVEHDKLVKFVQVDVGGTETEIASQKLLSCFFDTFEPQRNFC